MNPTLCNAKLTDNDWHLHFPVVLPLNLFKIQSEMLCLIWLFFTWFDAVSQKRETRWVGPTQSQSGESSQILTHSWLGSEKTFSIFSFFFKCPITEVKVPLTTTHSRDNPFLVSLSLSFSLFYFTILNSINLSLAFMFIYLIT